MSRSLLAKSRVYFDYMLRRARSGLPTHAASKLLAQPYLGAPSASCGRDETVCHSRKEYARGDVNTNSIEGFFSLVKRGITGIYHNVSKEHLHRYLAEYEFRYNRRHLEDGERTTAAIRSSQGKRLVYSA